MKIKTTEEIIDTEQYNKGIYTHISDKKWVAVNEIHKKIAEILSNSSEDIVFQAFFELQKEFLNELKKGEEDKEEK